MNLLSWFTNESIYPNVRALNSTISVHSTPNSIIGKKYYVWRLQVSYLVDLSTSPYFLMLERWMLPFSYIRRTAVLLVRDILYEDRKWVFLADLSTSLYFWMLERWMLRFSYIQRPTVLLVRDIVSEDHKWVFLAYLITSSYFLMLERWMLPFSYIRRPAVLLVRDTVYEDRKWVF